MLWWDWKEYYTLNPMKSRHHMLAWDGDMVYIHSWPGVMQRQHEGIYLLSDRKEVINRIVYDYWFTNTGRDINIDKYIKELLK